jgi:secreted trypsin-like serine protease
MPDILQEISLAIVDQEICNKNMESLLPIREGMICAGGKKDKSVCYGDSGSSLFCLINEKFIQFGITSWGKPYCDSDGYQSVFTRVSYYSDWISNKIDNN